MKCYVFEVHTKKGNATQSGSRHTKCVVLRDDTDLKGKKTQITV